MSQDRGPNLTWHDCPLSSSFRTIWLHFQWGKFFCQLTRTEDKWDAIILKGIVHVYANSSRCSQKARALDVARNYLRNLYEFLSARVPAPQVIQQFLPKLYARSVLNATRRHYLDSLYQTSIRRALRAHWLDFFAFHIGETALRETDSGG